VRRGQDDRRSAHTKRHDGAIRKSARLCPAAAILGG